MGGSNQADRPVGPEGSGASSPFRQQQQTASSLVEQQQQQQQQSQRQEPARPNYVQEQERQNGEKYVGGICIFKPPGPG